MYEVAVIESARAAEAALDPIRSSVLAELRDPASAAGLAIRMGLPRQKLNYHLRELEKCGLVQLIEERRRGNMTERVMQSTARSYVISPITLQLISPDPRHGVDQLSARWMVAVAARLVQDVGTLISRATAAKKPLATYTVDSELNFATAHDRATFVTELNRSLAELVSSYASPATPASRPHRLVVALHPSITAEGTARHNVDAKNSSGDFS